MFSNGLNSSIVDKNSNRKEIFSGNLASNFLKFFRTDSVNKSVNKKLKNINLYKKLSYG